MASARSNEPSSGAGAAAGLLLTAPLISVWYLASTVTRLPFVPFDLFDDIARILPGGVVTTGIDQLVRTVRALHAGSTASAAKIAEQTAAVALFLAVGVAAGALVFRISSRAGGRVRVPASIVSTAIAAGACIATFALHQHSAAGVAGGGAWIGVTVAAWGLGLAWMHERLRRAPERSASPGHRPGLGRREFLAEVAGAAAVATIGATTLGTRIGTKGARSSGRRWSSQHALPNANDPVQPVPGTRSELTNIDDHYRIDIDTRPPVIHDADWRLTIGGLVDRPARWSLQDIRAREPRHQFITLSCISNPVGGDLIGTTRWTGVSLASVLPEWAVQSRASHLGIRSADGYYEVVPLDLIRRDPRVMLTYAWDGVPLPVEHGFPLRIYIPNVYGMKQPKWIESIDAIDRWEAGYWVARGWDREATMKATSVIDAVRPDDARGMVQAGGFAHAGVRGISRVELRMDEGEWREAQLRAPLSESTWRLWRADLPAASGTHALTVRCYEGDGTPQLTVVAPPHPSGASGLYRRIVTL